jgi:hypothetical protein
MYSAWSWSGGEELGSMMSPPQLNLMGKLNNNGKLGDAPNTMGKGEAISWQSRSEMADSIISKKNHAQ